MPDDISFEYATEPGDSIEFELTEIITVPTGGVLSVVAGANVTVDATDPANPIVSATGGGEGGTSDHRALTNRNDANQHTTASITGLDTALGLKANTADLGTAAGSDTGDFDAAGTAATAVAAEAVLARNADNLTSGTVADARVASTIARDSEVTAAVAAEATLARNADNLSSGTVADARIASTIARDSEVTAAVAAEATLARNGDNITSGTVADARIASTIARDSEVTSAVAAEALLARNSDNLTSGELVTSIPVAADGDLWLAVASRVAGVVEGGVIREVTSLQFPWTYTQTVDPTDAGIGTAVNVEWYATLSGGAGISAPNAATGWFGPRPTFNLEGRVQYASNMAAFAMEPIGFGDLLRVSNNPGVARTLNPAWSIMSSRMILADAATVTLGRNDTNLGGAAFSDTKAHVTLNSGTIDGTTNTIGLVSFMSRPLLCGNVSLSRRVAFDAMDLAYGDDPYITGPTTNQEVLDAREGLAGEVDAGGPESVAENIGFWARPGTNGVRNIGLLNESATVETPVTVNITASSSTIPIQSTVAVLNPNNSYILASTPVIAAGKDGQRLTLVNSHATHAVTLSGELVTAGTGLVSSVIIVSKSAATLRYSATIGKWLVESQANSQMVTETSSGKAAATATGTSLYIAPADTQSSLAFANLLSTPFINMGVGGSTGADLYLQRGGTGGVLSVSSGFAMSAGTGTGQVLAGQMITINAQTGTAYACVAADKSKHVTRLNAGASTHTWGTPTSLSIAAGSRIPVTNLGAGTVTHSGTGGATVTGHTAQTTDQVVWATALSTTAWHLAH